jgi:starch phosphorylase
VDRVKPIRQFTVRAVVPGSLSALEELAGNLRWSWHEPTKRLFEHIDPELWRSSRRDPVAFLGEVDPTRLDELAPDGGYVEWAERERTGLRAYLSEPRWFQSLGTDAPRTVAYFSPEFGIAAALPQYSAASASSPATTSRRRPTSACPLVGVGLFYRPGTSASRSRPTAGSRRATRARPDGLPLRVLRTPTARPSSHARAARTTSRCRPVWQAAVGRVRLLLLDTDVPENTDELRASPTASTAAAASTACCRSCCSASAARGRAASPRSAGARRRGVPHQRGPRRFLGLERIATSIAEGLSFAEALEAVRASTVFTTHTPSRPASTGSMRR